MDTAYLMANYSYDPDTGAILNKKGSVVGGTSSNGYVNIKTRRGNWLAHRMAFVFMTGDWPKGQVDHIDRNKHNNRWDNLRDVDAKTNRSNSEQSIPSCRAARWDKQMNQWLKLNQFQN
jgi:hypothetical protein